MHLFFNQVILCLNVLLENPVYFLFTIGDQHKVYFQVNLEYKCAANCISAYYNIFLFHNTQSDNTLAIQYNFFALQSVETVRDPLNILVGNNGLDIAYYSIVENDKSNQYLKHTYIIVQLKNIRMNKRVCL